MFMNKPLGLFMPSSRPALIKGLLPSWSYADYFGSSSTPGTTHNFVNINAGRPAPNRYLVFTALYTPADNGSGATMSLAVNGVAATQGAVSNANVLSTAIYCIKWPYGERIAVQATSSETLNVVGFACLPMYGLTSATAHDSAASGALFQSSRNGALDCPAGGVIVGAVFHGLESNNTSWTNLANELLDDNDGTVRWSSAYEFFAAAQTNRSITASWGSAGVCNLALASYPAVA